MEKACNLAGPTPRCKSIFKQIATSELDLPRTFNFLFALTLVPFLGI